MQVLSRLDRHNSLDWHIDFLESPGLHDVWFLRYGVQQTDGQMDGWTDADDATPYNINLTHELIINELEETSSILLKWFNNNYVILNGDKSDFLMSGNKSITNTDNNHIKYEDIQELLGITIDSKLTFEIHINRI